MKIIRRGSTCFRTLAVVAGLLLIGGCNRAPDGPKRNLLKGQITFRGKAVRGGRIVFAPDDKKGSAGPGAIAFIRDGKYETPAGHGVVSGPHVVDILGYDEDVDMSTDAEPRATVRRMLHVDLPEDGGTQDFNL